MKRNKTLSCDIFDEGFLEKIFAISDENLLPEMPPNYPPFFSWDRVMGIKPEKVVKLWRESNSKNRNINPVIYVHIPFCSYICKFCGFYRKIPDSHLEIEYYLKALVKETIYFKDAFKNFPIRALFFGGGTPTILSEKQLEILMKVFKENFTITSQTKIAMEASPHTLTYQKAVKLKELGVNYLAIGIQSFNEELMRGLGRPQTQQQAINALNNAIKAGIENIEADLIVGLPGQTEEIFMRDIEILSQFELQRVYIFDWQPRKFSSYNDFHSASLYGESMDKARAWRKKGIDWLIEKKGYIMRCGHWIFKGKGGEWPYTYDQQEEKGYSTLGLGASSITYCAGKQRYQNVSDVGRYISLIEKGLLPVEKIVFLSKKDEIINYAVVKFLHTGQLVLKDFKEKFGKSPEKTIGLELKRLLEMGRILKTCDSYILKNRNKGVFDLSSVFFPPKIIYKLASYADIRIAKKKEKSLISENKSLKNIHNKYSKLCFLREGLTLYNLIAAKDGLKERPLEEIFIEISHKKTLGLKQIVFCDSEPISFKKAYLMVYMAGKKGLDSAFMCPAFDDLNSYNATRLKNAGLSLVYLPLSLQENNQLRIFKESGIKFFFYCGLGDKEFKNFENKIKLSKKKNADGLLFILPVGSYDNDCYLLYKKLKENTFAIADKAAAVGIRTVILNSLPCLLYPKQEELFESFLFIPDARESEEEIIKLESCLVCKYLTHCPGPHEDYFKSPLRISDEKTVSDGRFCDIIPIVS
ncbi:MAG: coproporphyrinogen-III oxidase family protein [Elusimicrobiales bacterium]